jgi:hypothetical protein
MDTAARMSTSSSRDDCVNEAGRGTSTLVGVPPAKASPMPSTMPPSSRTRSKRSMGSESSSISSANVTSPSSKFDKKKTKKKQRKEKKLTESHLKVRAAADVSRKWELDLEHVHGLADEQACVVVLLMAPPLMLHAKEGWKYMKEVKRLAGLYPECLEDQTFMNGEWVML